MQQFCYTSCRGGHSVTGADGWQVRAVSCGISEQQARSYEQLFRYSRHSSDPANGYNTPAKLAFTTEPRRMLIHTVPSGQDPTTGRTGNYFAHVIVDTPDDVTALDAISSWGSVEWITRDFEGSALMTQPMALPRSSLAIQDSLTFLKDAARRRWAVFCVQAILTSEDSHLYLAGDPETLVRLIHIVALCLPLFWRRSLSFSTYEGEPGNLKVRITGTSFSQSMRTDLPEYCYTNGRFALNTYTDRQNRISYCRYAERAVGILAAHGSEAISDFVAVMDESKVRNADDLNVLAGALPIPDGIESLNAALAWTLTEPAKETVIAVAVKSGLLLPKQAITYLQIHPSSLIRLLPDLLSSRDYDHTIKLLKSLYPGLEWAEQVLKKQEDIASHVMQRVVFDLLQNYGVVDRALFCERNIDRLSLRPEVTPFLCSFIETLSPERAVTKSAAVCCQRIYRLRRHMPGTVVSRCRAFLDIGQFLNRPSVSTAALNSLARAMCHLSLQGQLGRRIVADLSGMVSPSNWSIFASFIRSQPKGWFSSSLLERLCRRLLASPRQDDAHDLLSAAIVLVVERNREMPLNPVNSMVKDAVALNPALRLAVFRQLAEERPVQAFRFINIFLSPPHRIQLLVSVSQTNRLPRMEILKCLIRVSREDLDRACSWRILHDHLPSMLCLLKTPAASATLLLWDGYVAQYPVDLCDDIAGGTNLRLLRELHAPMQAEMSERLAALCTISDFMLLPGSDDSVLASVGYAFARLHGKQSPILTSQLVHAILSIVGTGREAGDAIGKLRLPDPVSSAAVLVTLINEVVEERHDKRVWALRMGLFSLILGTDGLDGMEKEVEAVSREERVILAQRIWTVLSRAERQILVAQSKDYSGIAKDLWDESLGRKRDGRIWSIAGLRRVFGKTKGNGTKP